MPYIGNIVQDFSVNTAMLNSDSVTSIKIVDGTIQGADIAANLDLSDNQTIRFGDSQDALIFHSGSQLNIDNNTGNIFYDTVGTHYFRVGGGNETAITAAANGSVELYHDNVKKIETSADGVNLPDNSKLQLGDSQDLQLYHDSNNSVIDNNIGDFYILSAGAFIFQTNNNENAIKCVANGSVELYHDNVKKAETASDGLNVEGTFTCDDILVANTIKHEGQTNTKIEFDGTSIKFVSNGVQRLSITQFANFVASGHKQAFVASSGENPFIRSTGTNNGDLEIGQGTESMAQFKRDGAVELYHNGTKQLETTSTGITTTGKIGIGTATPDEDLVISDVSPSIKLTSTSTVGNTNIYFGDTDSATQGQIQYHNNGDFFRFFTNGSNERLRITSAGKVGISTSTPQVTLDVGGASSGGLNGLTNSVLYAGFTNNTNFGGVVIGAGANGNTPFIAASKKSDGTALPLDIITNGSSKVRLGTDGTVGIGTTSPAENLHIRATSNVGIRLDDSGHSYGNIIYNNGSNSTDALTIAVDEGDTQPASTIRFRVDASEKMRLTSDGRLGVGLTSPGTQLHVAHASVEISALDTTNCLNLGLRLQATGASNTTGNIYSGITLGEGRAGLYAYDDGGGAAHGLGFWTGSNSGVAERVRIDKDGKVLINTTTVLHSSMLTIKGVGVTTITTEANLTSAFTHHIFNNPNGQVGDIRTSGSSTIYNTSSDYRLKENVVAISDGITRLKTLKPYRFNFKADASTTVDGFFAHEVTAVPEAISGIKDEVVTQAMIDAGKYEEEALNDPIYQGIDQSKLVPLLVAAVQEEISKREALESRVAALEAA